MRKKKKRVKNSSGENLATKPAFKPRKEARQETLSFTNLFVKALALSIQALIARALIIVLARLTINQLALKLARKRAELRFAIREARAYGDATLINPTTRIA